MTNWIWSRQDLPHGQGRTALRSPCITRPRALAFVCAFGLLSTACSNETASLNLAAYNHTSAAIGAYSVIVPGYGTGSAGFLDAGTGGGGFTCCITIPKVWKPGMVVTVSQWSRASGTNREKRTTVVVPQYGEEDISRFNVHFLRDGRVKVFVSRFGLRNRQYPLQGSEAQLRAGQAVEYVN